MTTLYIEDTEADRGETARTKSHRRDIRFGNPSQISPLLKQG